MLPNNFNLLITTVKTCHQVSCFIFHSIKVKIVYILLNDVIYRVTTISWYALNRISGVLIDLFIEFLVSLKKKTDTHFYDYVWPFREICVTFI